MLLAVGVRRDRDSDAVIVAVLADRVTVLVAVFLDRVRDKEWDLVKVGPGVRV